MSCRNISISLNFPDWGHPEQPSYLAADFLIGNTGNCGAEPEFLLLSI